MSSNNKNDVQDSRVLDPIGLIEGEQVSSIKGKKTMDKEFPFNSDFG